MTMVFSVGDETPRDLVAATEDMFREAAEEFYLALRKVRGGESGEVKAAMAAVKDLKAAFQLAMEERTRVDRLRKQVGGAEGGQCLDFDAARDEIGRRLACLRDAGGGE